MSQLKFSILQKDVTHNEFDCGVDSINKMVEESYYATLLQQCLAFEISEDGRVIGYCMILLRTIQLAEFPDDIQDYTSELCTHIPAVEIKYIAIKRDAQRQNRGTMVLRTLIEYIRKLCNRVPIRVIEIDALVNLVKWYEKEGFKEMCVNTPGQEGYSKHMFIDCLMEKKKLDDYISEKCLG